MILSLTVARFQTLRQPFTVLMMICEQVHSNMLRPQVGIKGLCNDPSWLHDPGEKISQFKKDYYYCLNKLSFIFYTKTNAVFLWQ